MSKTVNIPKGYKQSQLGLIPEEWEVKRLGELGEIKSGTTPSREKFFYYSEGTIPWVKTLDLNNGIVLATEEKVTNKAIEDTSLVLLPRGTILVAMYGGFNQIGRTGILGIEATINQAISGVVLGKEYDAAYTLQYLNLNVNRWRKYAASSRKDPNITGKDVFNFNLTIPPLPEQRKIAEVLSTWDKAIELQTAIIDKLTLRKKGLMQQLLSGKKRLKGFSELWKQVKIGDVGKTYTGLTGLNKEDFENIGSKYIPYINIYKNSVVDTNSLCDVRINDSCQNMVKCGDVFFTTSSETPDEVGVASVLLEDVDDLYLNSFCFGYRILDIQMLSSEYSVYLFRSANFRHEIIKLAQGSTRFNISKEEVMKVKLFIPSIKEQLAIAGFLGSADKEIEKEKQKLAALKQQKKGLMQQLLTGKKRVVV